MRKSKVVFYQTDCKGGCGQVITTTNRSIIGLDKLHKEYAGYCEKCSKLTEYEAVLMQSKALCE